LGWAEKHEENSVEIPTPTRDSAIEVQKLWTEILKIVKIVIPPLFGITNRSFTSTLGFPFTPNFEQHFSPKKSIIILFAINP